MEVLKLQRIDLSSSLLFWKQAREPAYLKDLYHHPAAFYHFPSATEDWKKDKDTENCSGCSSTFTLLNRRSHCRSCGDVFCSMCCKKGFTFCPPLNQLKSNQESKKLWVNSKVCTPCFNRLNHSYSVSKKEYMSVMVITCFIYLAVTRNVTHTSILKMS